VGNALVLKSLLEDKMALTTSDLDTLDFLMYRISAGPFTIDDHFGTSNDGTMLTEGSMFWAEVIVVTVKWNFAVVLSTAGATKGDSINNNDPDNTVNW
jgi:hypothetical protein